MKIKEMIEVMQAFDDGKAIQISQHSYPDVWHDDGCPGFNWYACDYRVKPEPKPATLESRIKAEFPDKRVVMLHHTNLGSNANAISCLVITYSGVNNSYHTAAQSMKGFYKYIYEVEDGSFVEVVGPVLNCVEGVLQPCAVLFLVQS